MPVSQFVRQIIQFCTDYSLIYNEQDETTKLNIRYPMSLRVLFIILHFEKRFLSISTNHLFTMLSKYKRFDMRRNAKHARATRNHNFSCLTMFFHRENGGTYFQTSKYHSISKDGGPNLILEEVARPFSIIVSNRVYKYDLTLCRTNKTALNTPSYAFISMFSYCCVSST